MLTGIEDRQMLSISSVHQTFFDHLTHPSVTIKSEVCSSIIQALLQGNN